MSTTISVTFKVRRDTAANWTSANPVLHLGEVGWEIDTNKAKLGDGVRQWSLLPYASRPINAVNDVPGLQTALNDKAPINDPVFGGDATADGLLVTGFLQVDGTSVFNNTVSLGGSATATTPATADNDTSVATTAFVKAQGYAPLASPTFTGDPKAPTPATADNDTSVATTAYVKAQGYATTASPTFTGDPKAPTPATTDNDTSIATTAFVNAAMAAGKAVGAARQITTFSVPNGAATKMPLDNSLIATNITVDIVNDRLIATKAGTYLIFGRAALQSVSTTGDHSVFIRVNGVATNNPGFATNKLAGGWSMPNAISVVTLAVNDYIELWASQNTGGSVSNTLAGATDQWCSYLGAVLLA